ncbi:MAG: DMT family transporter [Kiloniellales bacterium]|jgi:drug/metabolite transporter (DMT)-like permease
MSVAIGTHDRIGLGIASMMVAVAAMSAMDAVAKWLGQGYPIVEIVFFRNLFALLPIFFIVWQGGGRAALKIGWGFGFFLRAALGMGAMLTFFTGLRYLPLAEAFAIAFVAPLFVTLLSIPLLGEQVGARRWGAVIVGFIGVLVMTRPGAEAFQPAALLILAAALFYALAMLVTRRLARTDSTPSILLYTTGLSLVASAALLPFGWRSPTGEDLMLFALLGLIAGGGNYFMTQAYRHAPAAVVAPFDYTALIWGTILGWLIWHELPGPHVWLGVAILVASGLYIIHRETRLGRTQKKLDPIGID